MWHISLFLLKSFFPSANNSSEWHVRNRHWLRACITTKTGPQVSHALKTQSSNGHFRWKIATTPFKPLTRTVINNYTTQDSQKWHSLMTKHWMSTNHLHKEPKWALTADVKLMRETESHSGGFWSIQTLKVCICKMGLKDVPHLKQVKCCLKQDNSVVCYQERVKKMSRNSTPLSWEPQLFKKLAFVKECAKQQTSNCNWQQSVQWPNVSWLPP